jgi:hypothetical protein
MIIVSENTIDKLKGQYCKIVYKQKGDKKSSVAGEVMGLNNAGFILIENQDGIHCLNTRKIISIKSQEKIIGEEL